MNQTYQIIAVDFDGTLCYSKWPELGEPNVPLIEYLKDWKAFGNKLILWTCRAGEALESALSWCRDHQLEFDAVNDNIPKVIEMYGNDSRKISFLHPSSLLTTSLISYRYRLRKFLFPSGVTSHSKISMTFLRHARWSYRKRTVSDNRRGGKGIQPKSIRIFQVSAGEQAEQRR